MKVSQASNDANNCASINSPLLLSSGRCPSFEVLVFAYTNLWYLIVLCCVVMYCIFFYNSRDWGGAALGGQDLKNVNAVAAQMGRSKEAHDTRFVINTGDSFYWCGIQNTSDYQINVDFVQPYGSFNLPFYGALGNHEYGRSIIRVYASFIHLILWLPPLF